MKTILFKVITILFLLAIMTSCVILPSYRLQEVDYCVRKSYNYICEGTDEPYYNGRSIYD